ncbi:MAG: hypothetical protein K2I96_25790 [Lachnospiraceae bacterium]|nr:hypothetical protein [Lachnospiraceae bacterium]
MEVRSANIALTNRAAAAIDNSGSNGKEQQHAMKVSSAVSEENQELEEQSVMISISAAGLKRSLQLEKQAEKETDEEENGEEEFTGEAEIEDMMKKMEGLSSQVINGHFSISDRLNFNNEIEKLTNELNRLNGGNTAITKNSCVQLAQKISDLTRSVSDAAVYRNSARTVFMVNSKQPAKPMNTRVDIVL